MAKYKKSFTNPHMYKYLLNSPSEMFDYTMSNVMDGFYDGAMSSATAGKFKAVCLSGIGTEATTGGSTSSNDAVKEGDFLTIIVRPLTSFGNILPDPRDLKDPVEINKLISIHGSMFLARSDYQFEDTNGVDFAQVVDCYFENGSIANSDFSSLRFSAPKSRLIDITFNNLATLEGVRTSADLDWQAASLLGTSPTNAALGAEHLGAPEANFADKKFGEPGSESMQKRKKAWQALRPFLPKDSRLTSVYRNQIDQDNIIKNYATRNGWTEPMTNKKEITAARNFITAQPTPGYYVARFVGLGHGGAYDTGALDIAPKRGSSTTLDQIWASVEEANKALVGKVKFADMNNGIRGRSSIMEPANGCVHVFFDLSDINL